jgi:hypothetical protein
MVLSFSETIPIHSRVFLQRKLQTVVITAIHRVFLLVALRNLLVRYYNLDTKV